MSGRLVADRPAPIVLDHDGSVDDIVALLLAVLVPQLDLRAVIVTDGDCYGAPALAATRKLCHALDAGSIPVALSDQRAVNPFPSEWRRDSLVLNELPALNRSGDPRPVRQEESGEALLADVLSSSAAPITVVATGPLSNLARLCLTRPDLLSRIGEVVWMGGALDVPGNVDPYREPTHDGTAEWNAYWDPDAVATVLASPLPLTVLPLDVTNELRIDPDFLRRVRVDDGIAAQICSQAYALVCFREYYAWDVGAVAYVAWPELFRTDEVRVAVMTSGPSAGRLYRDHGGRRVRGVMGVDRSRLWERLAALWSSDSLAVG